jgi:hypothetical protein
MKEKVNVNLCNDCLGTGLDHKWINQNLMSMCWDDLYERFNEDFDKTHDYISNNYDELVDEYINGMKDIECRSCK